VFSRHTITARKAVRQRTLFCAGGLTAKNPCATSVTATCSLYIANNSAGVFEASSGQQPPKAALNSGAAKSPCSGAVAASDAILADATVCAMMRFCTGDMRGGTAGATEPTGTDTREPSTTAATHATATAHARAIAMVALYSRHGAGAARVLGSAFSKAHRSAVGGSRSASGQRSDEFGPLESGHSWSKKRAAAVASQPASFKFLARACSLPSPTPLHCTPPSSPALVSLPSEVPWLSCEAHYRESAPAQTV
jgi:hypothetical protein